MSRAKVGVLAAFTIMLFLGLSQSLTAQFRGARDPGVRGGPDGAGDMLPNLTAEQQEISPPARRISPRRRKSTRESARASIS